VLGTIVGVLILVVIPIAGYRFVVPVTGSIFLSSAAAACATVTAVIGLERGYRKAQSILDRLCLPRDSPR